MAEQPKKDAAPATEPKMVTMDAEALKALIASEVSAGIARAQAGEAVKADDFEQAMRTIRGQDKPPTPIRYEDCESPLTGARFRAKIMASRMTPLGRVVDLEDYVFPAGIDKPQRDGGLMPDRFVPAIEAPEAPASSALKTEYDHWKYWEFRRADQVEYASSKPFSRYILRSEADKRRALDAAAVAEVTKATAAE